MMRTILSLFISCVCFAAYAQIASVDDALVSKIAESGATDVLVVFEDYPDLSPAFALATKEEKGRFVVNALRQNSARHAGLIASLQHERLAYKEFWVANSVLVYDADLELLNRMQQEPGVERLAALPTWQLEVEAAPQAQAGDLASRSVQATWGVRYLGAPAVWDSGVKGEGVVVGGQDTGYDWTHPALNTKYRGYIDADSADHNYNWHDAVHERSPLNSDDNNPCGFDVRVPCDDGSHGTHTMGTMVGSDGAENIGVAPDAAWIGCRSMERGWGRAESYLECFQWFVAPTDLNGENPRSDKAPDVIANSWYCPLLEGCDDSTFPAYDNVVQALRAAGVVVVASAGNAGRSGCGTVNRIPAQSPGAIAVAAHDSLGRIANFSSLGTGDEPLNGPDIAAPGVAVRSSVPGNGYSSFSGTSMAGPHLAGVVALMISANPALRGQVDTIASLLFASANAAPATAADTCSAPGGPNQVFGAGLANAVAAVAAAQNWGGISNTAFAKTLPITVSPNPMRERLVLEVPADVRNVSFRILNGTGQVVASRVIEQTKVELDTGNWPAGAYFYELTSDAGSATGTLIKQ